MMDPAQDRAEMLMPSEAAVPFGKPRRQRFLALPHGPKPMDLDKRPPSSERPAPTIASGHHAAR